jgi:hypothetical protein
MPRAPLPEASVTRFRVVSPTTSKGATPLSSLIRAHAPDQPPPPKLRVPHFYPVVCAGCCQPLLDVGLSRHYLRASFPACLDLYPGASPGAPTRFFPGDIGLHHLGIGSATHNSPYSDFRTGRISGLSVIHSCSGLRVCSPPRSLLPQCCHWAAVAFTSEPMTVCSLPVHRICYPSESGN